MPEGKCISIPAVMSCKVQTHYAEIFYFLSFPNGGLIANKPFICIAEALFQ